MGNRNFGRIRDDERVIVGCAITRGGNVVAEGEKKGSGEPVERLNQREHARGMKCSGRANDRKRLYFKTILEKMRQRDAPETKRVRGRISNSSL